VRDDPELRERIWRICHEQWQHTWGHRHVRARLRKLYGVRVSRKTVHRIMREMGLCQKKVRRRPYRPKRVMRMLPEQPNQGWQIDMTCFNLSSLKRLYLVVIVDCRTREIVGHCLDERCRAVEWIAALRTALQNRGLDDEALKKLTLRSDNGAQPCSRRFADYLRLTGVNGEFTGYAQPNDNCYVERTIRTLKEEHIKAESFDSYAEARDSIQDYIDYYNNERMHSALNYDTPAETYLRLITLKAA
jgi:transposase InsO family protein